jgi:hypothetical protein
MVLKKEAFVDDAFGEAASDELGGETALPVFDIGLSVLPPHAVSADASIHAARVALLRVMYFSEFTAFDIFFSLLCACIAVVVMQAS